MEVPENLCSSCRRRVAVYKRVTSGERLCRLCLFRSVVKQVRKAVHYYKMVRRGSAILYVIRPEAVGESLAGLHTYKVATKDFNLRYYVLCLSDVTDCDLVKNAVGHSDVELISIRDRIYT